MKSIKKSEKELTGIKLRTVFSINLRKFMAIRRVTQERLAKALGLSRGTIQCLTTEKSFPSCRTLEKLAAFFSAGYFEFFMTPELEFKLKVAEMMEEDYKKAIQKEQKEQKAPETLKPTKLPKSDSTDKKSSESSENSDSKDYKIKHK